MRLGYVSENDRLDLLAGATVFAFPSRYEGFGHPPLEAMAARVPVVAARTGALPEVLGDAAVLVSPTDEEEIAEALLQVASDDELRGRLRTRGSERVSRYRWERAVDELAALYRSLA